MPPPPASDASVGPQQDRPRRRSAIGCTAEMHQPARVRIERFLRQRPLHALWVWAPAADAAGLRWLNDQTRHRPVRIITSAPPESFAAATGADRDHAVRLLTRDDVEVLAPAAGSPAPTGQTLWVLQPRAGDDTAELLAGGGLTGAALRSAGAAPLTHRPPRNRPAHHLARRIRR